MPLRKPSLDSSFILMNKQWLFQLSSLQTSHTSHGITVPLYIIIACCVCPVLFAVVYILIDGQDQCHRIAWACYFDLIIVYFSINSKYFAILCAHESETLQILYTDFERYWHYKSTSSSITLYRMASLEAHVNLTNF